MAALQSIYQALVAAGPIHHRVAVAAVCLAWSAAIVSSAGCASHAARIREARLAYFDGELDIASQLLEQVQADRKKERDCLLLDRALVELMQGRPAESERMLREVRDRFDSLEQHDAVESSLAMLTDDTRASYAGEDYEKVLLRALLAISSLLRDGTDAVPYCLQVEQKQQEIVDRGIPGLDENPKLSYKQVALGAYLRGVVQEETHRAYDDAERAFATVASWEPQFAAGKLDLQRARAGVHSARGNGVVYILTFVGRGPYKEEAIAEATSDVLLVADRILSVVGDHTLPPTIAPVKIPRVVVPTNPLDSVAVDVDGRPAGLTQTITDVGELAVGQYMATRTHVVAKAVARRVVKKAAVYATKDALQVDGGWTSLALDVAGVAWEATETADTRCWGLLPEKIQVLRLELPAGTHWLDLRAARFGRPVGPASTTSVEVLDGRNTYVLASFPGLKPAGKTVVSQPGRQGSPTPNLVTSHMTSTLGPHLRSSVR